MLTHITGLPPHESATGRKSLGESAGWDNRTEFQAATVDLLHVILRTFQVANFKDAPTDEVPRIPRPFETQQKPQAVSLSDFARMMEGT